MSIEGQTTTAPIQLAQHQALYRSAFLVFADPSHRRLYHQSLLPIGNDQPEGWGNSPLSLGCKLPTTTISERSLSKTRYFRHRSLGIRAKTQSRQEFGPKMLPITGKNLGLRSFGCLGHHANDHFERQEVGQGSPKQILWPRRSTRGEPRAPR